LAKTPPAPVPSDAQDAPPASGKGHATPSRAEQEAARRRPLVPDTKEAKARAKAQMATQREKARVGMANGDEKYLTARDKGPQRRFVRDWVDARWSLSEFVMPIMVLVIVATFIPNQYFAYWSMIGLWGYIFLVIAEMIVASWRVKRAVDRQFGADKREKGLGWYAAMRQVQMRFLRLPKPKVKRGGAPVG
jgi:hypothetical protein